MSFLYVHTGPNIDHSLGQKRLSYKIKLKILCLFTVLTRSEKKSSRGFTRDPLAPSGTDGTIRLSRSQLKSTISVPMNHDSLCVHRTILYHVCGDNYKPVSSKTYLQ